MGFSRQEYWSGLLCPPPGDVPDPGIEPMHVGSGFLTKDQTQPLCTGSVETYPLDHKASPSTILTFDRPHEDKGQADG